MAPRNILRLSRFLSVITLILMVATPVCIIAFWLIAPSDLISSSDAIGGTNLNFEMTGLKRIGAIVLSAVPLGITLYGLGQLRRLLGNFSRGAFFSADAVKALKRFSAACFYGGLAQILIRAAFSLLFTYDNPPGQKAVAISISSNDVFVLLFSGVFLLIASIMAEGRKIAAENAEII
ncbi:MAG: DUF2975 domain-containing protein [Pseudomonadota bacterium]